MCLIAVKGQGVELPKEKFMLHAEKRNSDGIGIMYWKPNTTDVCIKKDFKDAQEMIKWTHDNIKVEDILVIHFRLATHGLKDIGNRHPFPITKNKELLRKPELVCQVAVAHNGILNNYNHHPKFSDTQKFVLDILADESVKNNLDSEAVQKLINAFIDGDKLAILRNDGICYRYGDWEECEKIFYSNTGYKPFEQSFGMSVYNSVADWRNRFCNERSDFQPLNCSVVDKHGEAWVALCDGCSESKLVRYVEIEDNAFSLCKKCRKEVRKGKLQLDPTLEPDMVCDGCGEFVKEEELTAVDGAWKVCKKCYQTYLTGHFQPLDQDY